MSGENVSSHGLNDRLHRLVAALLESAEYGHQHCLGTETGTRLDLTVCRGPLGNGSLRHRERVIQVDIGL